MDLVEANRMRDRRLRRRLLFVLDLAKQSPTGGLSAVSLVDEVNGFMMDEQKFENEGHAIRLIRDLRSKGLINEKQFAHRKTERFGLRHMHLTITAMGIALLNENIAPDPDIEDERIMPGSGATEV